MATKKKMLQAAAGSAGGEALNVEDVFSTYLYTGNGSTQTITNGIDLAGEGGLVWIKGRSSTSNNRLWDTARGATNYISSDNNGPQAVISGLTSFNSDGFTLGSSDGNSNANNLSLVSWTFRKAPRFFDVVAYVGNGVSGRTLSHDLGVVPGCIMVKELDFGSTWRVYHRANTSEPETDNLQLSSTAATFDSNQYWADTAPTDAGFTVGSSGDVNANGRNYVAYLFAHNDGDGEFGPDGDADIIKCGSGTIDSFVDLGWEPQWVLAKATNSAYDWQLFDSMRGITPTGLVDPDIKPNSSAAEAGQDNMDISPTGFTYTYGPAQDFIYIAIRRGTKVPESGTEVFAVDTRNGTSPSPPLYTSGFVVDAALERNVSSSGSNILASRMTGQRYLLTDSTSAELAAGAGYQFDYNDGWYDGTSTNSSVYSWMWKRAPNFFDVVAYTGNGTAGRTVSHNLGVAPEMIWTAKRSSGSGFKVLSPNNALLLLHATSPEYADSTTCQFYGDNSVVISPTASDFTVGSLLNGNSTTFISYLFATLDGISKVGSYTGNGTSQTIDCGFTSGARFILVKRTDSTGDWYVWDTERGIVAGNDPHLSLNTTAAEVTSDDSIDPDSSGFIVNQVAATNINVSSASYIFYAIA